MKCLSVRQPFAWLMTHGPTPAGEPYKPVENRYRRFGHRGPLLVHASLRHDREWSPLFADLLAACPLPEVFEYGGIVGVVSIANVVDHHPSPWFRGPYALVVSCYAPLPFAPWRGKVGMFDVEDLAVVEAARRALCGDPA